MQSEHFLNPGQRREFFRGNAAQLGLGKPRVERIDHVAPAVLEQSQGVQGQGVEKAAAGLRYPGFQIGKHPDGFTLTGRRDRNTQHVAQRVRLIGGNDQHALTIAGVTNRGSGRQGGFSYPAFTYKKTYPGRGGRDGITQPSTRFFRSFNAPSINRRSALRLSIPIIGTARSTASS